MAEQKAAVEDAKAACQALVAALRKASKQTPDVCGFLRRVGLNLFPRAEESIRTSTNGESRALVRPARAKWGGQRDDCEHKS